MQPSTLGVSVGFKSIRRRRNKLTATQPWDEDDSDLGASLRKLFSATARNRAASLGRKTPREARKRSSIRLKSLLTHYQHIRICMVDCNGRIVTADHNRSKKSTYVPQCLAYWLYRETSRYEPSGAHRSDTDKRERLSKKLLVLLESAPAERDRCVSHFISPAGVFGGHAKPPESPASRSSKRHRNLSSCGEQRHQGRVSPIGRPAASRT